MVICQSHLHSLCHLDKNQCPSSKLFPFSSIHFRELKALILQGEKMLLVDSLWGINKQEEMLFRMHTGISYL